MKRVVSRLALAFTMLASSVAFAATTNYRSTMSGPGEQPPNNSPGASIATVVFDDTAMTMLFSIPFMNLVAGSTVAHLHCCTPQPLIGAAAPAIGLTGFQVGAQTGLYERMFNLADAATYDPAFLTAHGGTADSARFHARRDQQQPGLPEHPHDRISRRRNTRLPGGAGCARA